MTLPHAAAATHMQAVSAFSPLRAILISVIGFLTLTDLFAAQAILPSLAAHYRVMPSAIGFAVNSGTIGMAIASLGVALISRHIDRKRGIWVSLALLAIPTMALAWAPDLMVFAALRIFQGMFMAAAFTLTMAHLAENCSAEDTSRALAAYVTGVVASNLVGRLISAAAADTFGLGFNFYLFAALNLSGAVLVYATISQVPPMASAASRSPFASWGEHLRNPALRSAFTIGFLILFAFIGVFTYVNFVLTGEPIGLSRMALGLVYFVFLPSMFTTPMAGAFAARFGIRPAIWAGLAVAAVGLPFLLVMDLLAILIGMVLVGVGTFFAQAIATGFVGRAARSDRAAASGLYLASYYLGGLAGAAVLGQLFDRLGWSAAVGGVAVSLVIAAVMAFRLRLV